MHRTVIGVFDNPIQAEQARSEILALHIPTIDVQVSDRGGVQLTGGTDTSTTGFWKSLSQTLGFGPSNQGMHSEGVQRGGTVVSVSAENADDMMIGEITNILHRNGTVVVNAAGVTRDS